MQRTQEIFQGLPIELQGEIVGIVARNMQFLHPNREDLIFLFQVWNTYFQPKQPQDINCGKCRGYVYGKLKHLVFPMLDN